MGRTDTRTYAIFLPGHEFVYDLRVGNVRPCHSDHVQQILTDRIASSGNIGDSSRVKHRQAHMLFEFTDSV